MRSRVIFVLCIAMILTGVAAGFAAGNRTGMQALGLLAGRGSVWVDNELAPTSTALFPGEMVRTGHGSTASMTLHNGAMITLAEDGEMYLPKDGASGIFSLQHGVLLISNGGESIARFSVFGVPVEVHGQHDFPTLCRIASVGRDAAIFNDRGVVVVHGAGAPMRLSPGKYIQFGAGNPPGAPPQQAKAGSVTAEMPAETIQRQGQGASAPLSPHDDVNWQDVITTLNTGRVRIQLLDGSVLNIGARSTMHIVKHDPQAQQTTVILTLGKMRSEVVKLSKPGASFQVQTQTAVIGVVGTIFLTVATPTTTQVTSIEGVVTVQSINPAITGVVQLHPGESTSVPRGQAPSAATQANPAQVQTQVNQTQINPSGVSATATTAATGASNASSASGVAVNVSTVAAAGTSAGLGGVALSRVNSANSSLTQTNSQLQTAVGNTNNAVTAANNAAAAAGAAAASNQSILTAISTSSPICGCP